MSPTKSNDSLAELSDQLARLTTTEEKANAAFSLMQMLSSQRSDTSGTHHSNGGNPSLPLAENPFPEAEFEALMSKHGVSQEMFADVVLQSISQTSHALESAPCAWANISKGKECRKAGTAVCSGCRLVLYCSQECQKAHWKIHARDCKDPIRSDKWVPAWVSERRPPTFMTADPRGEPLSKGMALWGNMPAIDVLNIPQEEASSRASIDLAFVASGDLRNVVRSINGLPKAYTGQVTCLINDANPYVVLRNFFILQILGTVTDHAKAADMALHLLYSAFIPGEYLAQYLALCVPFVTANGDTRVVRLGPDAKLEALVGPELIRLCAEVASPQYTMGDATNELARVRFDASRVDLHHRHYARLEPSHRLAFMEYRRFGLVLPFGAQNHQFNAPNPFLFSRAGEWLLTDHDKPISGWDIEDIVKSGKAHGTTRQDLLGCLYFHVSDQLREFASRLTSFNVTFTLFNAETTKLARELGKGGLGVLGLPATTRFDRIEVSNIMDVQYLGIAPTIDAWGKFLKKTDDATLLGYFMNWHSSQTGARPEGEAEFRGLKEKLVKLSRDPLFSDDFKTYDEERALDTALGSIAHYHAWCSVYDNSAAFDEYLKKQRLNAALRRSSLKRRLKHIVHPHRLCAPLDGAPSALPEFKDKESWYLQSDVGAPMWSERFIEICRT